MDVEGGGVVEWVEALSRLARCHATTSADSQAF